MNFSFGYETCPPGGVGFEHPPCLLRGVRVRTGTFDVTFNDSPLDRCDEGPTCTVTVNVNTQVITQPVEMTFSVCGTILDVSLIPLGINDLIGLCAGSFIATVYPTAPPPPPPDEDPPDLAMRLELADQPSGNQIGIEETATARLTVAATDGAGSVSGITFDTDQIEATTVGIPSEGDEGEEVADVVEVLSGPEPPIDAPFDLAAAQARTFDYQVKGLRKGLFRLTSGSVTASNSDGPLSAGPAVLLGRSGSDIEVDVVPQANPLRLGEFEDNRYTVDVVLTNAGTTPITNLRIEGGIVISAVDPPDTRNSTVLDPQPDGVVGTLAGGADRG